VSSFLDDPKKQAMLACVSANILILLVDEPQDWIVEGIACVLLLGYAWWHSSHRMRAPRLAAKSQSAATDKLAAAHSSDHCNVHGIVSRCVRAGQLEQAEMTIREMRSKGLMVPLQTYSQVATAWARAGELHRSEDLLEQMLADDTRPDLVLIGAMVHAYACSRDLERAERWHNRIAEYGLVPDRSSFSRIINACAKASNLQKALEYLEAMKRGGIQPELVTFSCILDACAHAGDLEQAKLVFQQLRASGCELNAVPYACLGRIYAGRGLSEDTEALFQAMKEDGIAMNEYTVCTLLTAYGRCLPRQQEKAERCFRDGVAAGIPINSKVMSALRHAVTPQKLRELQEFAALPLQVGRQR
jgi:pentatricopeptide repeat protein